MLIATQIGDNTVINATRTVSCGARDHHEGSGNSNT